MNSHRPAGVRGLVFGGIMAALVVICAMVPVLSLLMPIPLVLTYLRYGGRAAVLAGVVSGIFAAAFMGPVQMLLVYIPGGLMPALAFGYGFRRNWRPLMTGILALVIFLLGSALTYVGTRALVLGGRDPIADMVRTEPVKSWLENSTSSLKQYYEAQPANTPNRDIMVRQMQEYHDHPVDLMWVLLPAGLLLAGAVITWINYKLFQLTLPRLGHPIPAPAPFSEFHLPNWSIWVFAAVSLASVYMGNPTTILAAPWWVKVFLNVVAPLQMIFALAGIAVAYGFVRKRGVAKGLAGLISLAGFLLGMNGLMLYVMLAIWDTLFDFRGLGYGLFRLPKPNP